VDLIDTLKLEELKKTVKTVFKKGVLSQKKIIYFLMLRVL